MIGNGNNLGVFFGRTQIQQRSSIGGARYVFVKLKGKAPDIFPTNGGELVNPFKGIAKIFAGDLFEYKVNGTVTLLKTYLVESMSGTTLYLIRDGFKHIPFVGDVIMKAPASMGGSGLAVTITAVKETVHAGKDVWECTISETLSGATENDILVEAEKAGASQKMLVKRVNAIAPCDYDFLYAPATGDEDEDGARYALTPVLHEIMWISRMSPVPACVLKANKSNVEGWFEL